MTTNEFYYLIMVIGAFVTFAVSMSLATIRYRAALRPMQAPAYSTVPVALRKAA